MSDAKGSIGICPKTGTVVEITTDFSTSSNDKMLKSDIECGKNCDYEPCPIIEQHNSIP